MPCLSKYVFPLICHFWEEEMFGLFGGCFESLRLSQFHVTDGAQERRCGCKEKHDLTAAPPHTPQLAALFLGRENSWKLLPCTWGVPLLREDCHWQPRGEDMCDPRGPGLSVGWDKSFDKSEIIPCQESQRKCNRRTPSSPGKQHAKALQIIPPSSNL